MALASGLSASLESCYQTPGKKVELGLLPARLFFFVPIFFTEAQQNQTDSSSLSYYPEDFLFLSQEGKKILKSQINTDEAVKQNGN